MDENIPYAADILGAEIVGSVRSLAIVLSRKIVLEFIMSNKSCL